MASNRKYIAVRPMALFRQGAIQGVTAKDASFVKCDRETTTQDDINLGIVNVVVGFAPLKPAELVILTLQQEAGQILVRPLASETSSRTELFDGPAAS